ncbi:hypothetical protein LV779_12305 [Streptomyces thinghirensis]|nr:hypothetical protein [Streptomyces thinghirensis]
MDRELGAWANYVMAVVPGLRRRRRVNTPVMTVLDRRRELAERLPRRLHPPPVRCVMLRWESLGEVSAAAWLPGTAIALITPTPDGARPDGRASARTPTTLLFAATAWPSVCQP